MKLAVTVEKDGKDRIEITDAFSDDLSLDDFRLSDMNPQVQKLAGWISDALCSKGDELPLMLKVTGYACVGKGQPVYPSQEMIIDNDKTSGKHGKSKILYSVSGQAAMHSQKLGNAVRTIDDWYEPTQSFKGPVAVEPYAAVTNYGLVLRPRTDKKDFYNLYDNFVADVEATLPNDDLSYVVAVLIRGGVFGEGKDKE